MLVRKSDILFRRVNQPCFHCNRPIAGNAYIRWDGYVIERPSTEILFHIECAQGFALRFNRDLYEALRGGTERPRLVIREDSPGVQS